MEDLRVMIKNNGFFKTSNNDDSGYDVGAIGYAKVTLNEKNEPVVGEKKLLNDLDYLVLKPHETVMIRTGVYLGLPEKKEFEKYYEIVEAQIRPRSGMSLKEHSNVKLGTIDNKYTGEIGVIFVNDGEKDLIINKYDRIAQIVFNKIVKYKKEFIIYVDELDSTSRGDKGFGSSGK